MHNKSEYISRLEATAYLSITRHFADKLIKEGILKPVPTRSGIFFKRADVEKLKQVHAARVAYK